MERAEMLARFFHETYERLAPEFGYETREETAVSWEEVPANNKALMTAVCQVILDREEQAEQEAEEEQTAMEEARGQARERLAEEGISRDDFDGWLLTKVSGGWPQPYLLKCAVISLNALMTAGDRWQRLEGGRSPSAPIWIDTSERDALLVAVKEAGNSASVKSSTRTTIRVLRQALEAILP